MLLKRRIKTYIVRINDDEPKVFPTFKSALTFVAHYRKHFNVISKLSIVKSIIKPLI